MDLHSELMKALHDVSMNFQGDEVDEGFKPSSQESEILTTAITQVSPSVHLGEIPHLVEVWGIDPLMKKFFESIYPSSTAQPTPW